jgi:2-dehydro-3-deoxyphosphogluconate aldolase/(4S)-4-hydroxy-2-oxoglutarate aldolase
MTRDEVAAKIEEIGIFPGIRVQSGDHALYCAEILWGAGIPVAEVTMTVPGGIEVIRTLANAFSDMVVGAGTVLDVETAQRCIEAGARFITSTGLVHSVVETTLRANIVSIPGALTPTEVIACAKAGADYVKIFPVAAVGGHLYVRSLKLPLPQVRLIAAGGVNHKNAADFIRAGASSLGVGMELIPRDAVLRRQNHRIHELARRFLALVHEARTTPSRS